MMARALEINTAVPRRRERPSSPPRIREAAFTDYDGICALHVRNGLAARSRDDWTAFWLGNPAYRGLEGQWPIGWVLETGEGEIVGSIGNIPFAYQFRGRGLRAGAACSWAVDPAYRSYSMLMLDRLTRQPNVDLLVSTTVSAAAEPAFGVFQWSRIPVGRWREAAFWITNYRGFLKGALTGKAIPLAAALSYAVSPLLFCRDRLMRAGPRANGSTGAIESCPGFDGRFDNFWEELKHQNGNALMAVRTRESLEWHFRYSLNRQAAWILAAGNGSRIVAYAVFDRFDSATWGLRRVRLVDFLALQDSEAAFGGIVRFMLRQCREERIDILECIGGWPGRLQAAAPYHRALPSWMYYYKASSEGLREALKDPAVWVPSSFDGDASI